MIDTEIMYPEGLPAPLREDHMARRVKPFNRTPMVSGRAINRRGFMSVPSIDSYSWLMNDSQAAFFELWFKEALNDGVEWFKIRRKTPLGIIDLICRFVDVYQGPKLVGVSMWSLTASLEAWERPLLDKDWMLLPDYVINPDIFDLAMNREWPEA